MLDVLLIIAPVFLAIAIGYGVAKAGALGRESAQGLGAFVLTIAMPALIVKALGRNPLAEVADLRYLAAYGGGSAVVFGLGFALSRVGLKRSWQASALAALGMATSNSGFIGYPIAAVVIGPPAVIGLALCMLVENLLVIPTALALAEAGTQNGATARAIAKASAARLIRNPLMLAILAGVVLSAFRIELPGPIAKTIDLFATASAPAALVAIGASLVGLNARGSGAEAVQIVAGKLLLHPLAVFLAFRLVGPPDPALKATGVIMASMPMVSIYPLLVQRYGLGEVCAAALMIATVLAVATTTVVIWLVTP
jgi:malonate transporter and related proteins